MASSFSLYPTLEYIDTSDMFKMSSYSFSYTEDGIKFPLCASEETGNIKIEDSRGVWTKEDNNLIIEGSIEIAGAKRLFGPRGIVCNDASLGLSASWYSHESNQRQAVEIGVIDNDKDLQAFPFRLDFLKSTFRGSLNVDIVLFIKRPGSPKSDEKKFANYSGCLLGCISSITLHFSGNGSFFPIYEESLPGEPLWRVKCDFSDASNDSFEENVFIFLNKAHDCYKYIDMKNPNVDKSLMAEILGDALFTVVEAVRSLDKDFSCLHSAAEGSVAQALLFFNRTLDWDFSRPETLTKAIRKYLSQKMN